MDSGSAVTIASVIQDATSVLTFFLSSLGSLLTATPIIVLPVALMLVRAATKNAKSLLFYSKGRRR